MKLPVLGLQMRVGFATFISISSETSQDRQSESRFRITYSFQTNETENGRFKNDVTFIALALELPSRFVRKIVNRIFAECPCCLGQKTIFHPCKVQCTHTSGFGNF